MEDAIHMKTDGQYGSLFGLRDEAARGRIYTSTYLEITSLTAAHIAEQQLMKGMKSASSL
jgi:hypothetical protein